MKEDGEREDDLFYVTQAKVSSENMRISHSPWNWQMFFFSRFVEVAGTWWDALWEHEIPKTQCVFFLSTSQSLHFAGHGEGEQADIVCEDGPFAAGREFANIFFSARDQKLLL